MDKDLNKIIIPAAGLSTRFLPVSKVVAKEFLPLVNEPMIVHVVREAVRAGISNIIFILPENKKELLSYFKSKAKLEGILQKRGQKDRFEKLKKIEEEFGKTTFSSAEQKIPKGDGDAVLRAKKQAGKGAFAVAFNDDIFESKIPAILQLKKVFTTSQKPVIGLKRISDEKLPSYGVVKVEKIANHLFKIKGIVEKPNIKDAPSNLAICGRYVLTNEIFSYLENLKPNKKGEIILADALKAMLEDGKIIYGCEIDGEWLECGKTIDWMKSNLYLSLQHPEYGQALRAYLKKLK